MKRLSLMIIVCSLPVMVAATSAQAPQAGAGGQNPAGQVGGRRGGGGPGGGQTPVDRPFRIVKNDPALDAIIAPDAKAELLGDRFGLNEGPVWVQEGANGYLLFSDMLDNVIYKWEANKPISVFLDKRRLHGARH